MNPQIIKLWGRVKSAFSPSLNDTGLNEPASAFTSDDHQPHYETLRPVESTQVAQGDMELEGLDSRDEKQMYLRDDGWHLGSQTEIEGWKRDERLIAELIQTRSPYKHMIEAANACGAIDDADRLEADELEWAADELEYLKSPEVKGLLGPQAKYCLSRDFGCDQALIDVLDSSRETRAHYAKSFNNVVERLSSSSQDIKAVAYRLLRISELSEPEKLKAVTPNLAAVYERFDKAVIPPTNERKYHEFRQAPQMADSGLEVVSQEQMLRKAPVLSQAAVGNQATVIRKAPMLEAVDATPGPDKGQQNNRNGQDKGPSR